MRADGGEEPDSRRSSATAAAGGLMPSGNKKPVSPPAAGRRSPHAPPERSASFHALRPAATPPESRQMRRPKTQPDLLVASRRGSDASPPEAAAAAAERRVPAKVLVNVTVQRSLGAVQVMASTEWTVHDLIAAAIKNYVKEGRRPLLPSTEPAAFGLHYSQFSLEGLDPKEKVISLGSRNFFLCPKAEASAPALARCSNEAEKAEKTAVPSWLRFMDFLL